VRLRERLGAYGVPVHHRARAKLTASAGEWFAMTPVVTSPGGTPRPVTSHRRVRLAEVRLLIIDDFALRRMDATETAEANTLS
jgi:hypothetical protein